MLVTDEGISTLTRLVHPRNATPPMIPSRDPSAKVTLARLLHPSNAEYPMLVIPLWLRFRCILASGWRLAKAPKASLIAAVSVHSFVATRV